MRSIVSVLLAGLCLGWTASAMAQPNIIELLGTARDGQTLTLRGAQYPTKAQAAPFRWDDFQDGVEGQRLVSARNGGTVWDLQGADYRIPTYSTGMQRYPGDMSALQDFDEAQNKAIAIIDRGPLTQLYVSFWIYRHDTGTALQSANNKVNGHYGGGGWTDYLQQRWETQWSNGSCHIYFADCAGTLIANNGCQDGTPHLGEWIRIERWLDMGDAGVANGYGYGKVNGEIAGEIAGTFRPTSGPDDCLIQSFFLGHYMLDGGMHQYVSEMYMDTTQLRVELGDNESWNACTVREIQVPTAWSSSEITVTMNAGAYPDGTVMHLHLIDETGRSVDSQPVVIGATYDGSDLGDPPGQPGQPIQQ